MANIIENKLKEKYIPREEINIKLPSSSPRYDR